MIFHCVANVAWIRYQLRMRFTASHLYPVTERSFLDLRNHWEDVVELILTSARALGCQLDDTLQPASFRITSVKERREVIGDDVGAGRHRLFTLNEDFLPQEGIIGAAESAQRTELREL